jgi:hypothetical protein
MKIIKKHFLDKPFLRHLFWFVVLPYKLKMFLFNERGGDLKIKKEATSETH